MASRIAWPPAVRDVCRRQIDQKQPAIGIDGNVTLAADDLLGRVEAARLGHRGLDRLARDHGGREARLTPRTLAVHHQRDVVERVEQQAPNEAPEPPVHRLPRREIAGQHLPATARTNQIADCVDHFPQIGLSRSAFLRWHRNNGAITDHSSSVRSVGYRLSFFLYLAMRPRDSDVHMDSLNHDRMPRLSSFKKPLRPRALSPNSADIVSSSSSPGIRPFSNRGRSDMKRVRRELGVEYLGEGSLRKASNRLRVTAKLIEAATGNLL